MFTGIIKLVDSAMDSLPLVLPTIGGAIAIAGGLFLIRAARYARRPAKGEPWCIGAR